MWAVGDVQGCRRELQRLLDEIPDTDRLLFLGDLVNRGPDSVGTLRLVRALGTRAIILLGNHDLHLLAVHAGVRRAHRDDTLAEILAAPDRTELIDWLRRQPLVHHEDGALFVHAGVLPQWTVAQAVAEAAELHAHLAGDDYRDFLATMYGNMPARWDETLAGPDRWRCAINALTRLRFVDAEGAMMLTIKDGAGAAPPGWVPWFDHPQRATRGTPIVFGHWSTLGATARDDAICLDSGCVWGGALSALHWPQRALRQVACPRYRPPGQV